MKKYKLFTILFIFCILLVACKKEKIDENIPNTNSINYEHYQPMAVGNYWIYQIFNMDGLGGETPISSLDSIYIEKDTIINGETYFKQVTKSHNYPTYATFLRDSLHYIINNRGEIMFSSEDFTNTFNQGYELVPSETDTLYWMHSKMTDKNMTITVPSGTYNTYNFQTTYGFPTSSPVYQEPKYSNKRYAKNIGVIIESYNFTLSPSITNYKERRLVRYHLE